MTLHLLVAVGWMVAVPPTVPVTPPAYQATSCVFAMPNQLPDRTIQESRNRDRL